MSLLTKAKVITTPTAYSDGILHSVKPNVVLGDELVTNGSFDTDSDWIKTNAVIANGKATITVVGGAYSVIRQALFTYVSGRSYVLEAEVQGTSGKACTFFDNGANIGGLTTSNGIVNFDGSVQKVYIEWIANANSDAILCARNGTGDFEFTIDNVSVKEKIDADFTFTRNSSATRVNELGYIEDVQIIGGELVSNGDFEEIGSELITNGSFDTDSDWDKGTGWSIANGKASCDGSQTADSDLTQNVTTLINKPYKVTYTISNYSAGEVKIRVSSGQTTTPQSSDGTFTEYVVSGGNSNIKIRANSDFIGSIDNVSVKEVGQNWGFVGEAEFTESGARIYSSSGSVSGINQSSVLTISNKYRIQYEIVSNTNGSLKIQGVQIPSSVGTHSYDFIASGTILEILRNSGATDVTIDNISVKEVTDDTNLPRINYEGFTYAESLGNNLLSDPVNLVTDFLTNSGGVIVDSNTFTTSGGSLDGIKKTFLTTGKRYKLVIEGSTTSSGFTIGNLSVSGNEYGSGFGTHYFTAANTGLWIRQVTAGTTDIKSFKVQEVIGDLPVPYSGKGHLLLEGQSTNLLPYSEDFTQGLWGKSGCTVSYGYLSPSNELNATKVTGLNLDPYLLYTLNGLTDLTYSASIYIKGTATTIGKIARLWIIRDNVTFHSEDFTITDTWQRLSTSKTFSTTPTGFVSFRLDTPNTDVSIGDETYVWGAMLEVGNLSSYIPTNGSAVTRLGETCSNAGNSDLINSTEGVLYAEIAALANDGTYREISLNDGTSNNAVEIRYTNTDNLFQFVVRDGGVVSVNTVFTLTNVLEFNKIALSYKTDDYKMYINGIEVATDTSGTMPSGLNRLSFNWSGSNHFYGKTKMVAVFPYLSNDEMECLTGEGYGSFEAMALANNYTII